MTKSNIEKTKTFNVALFIILGVFALATLIASATARNVVESTRAAGEYYMIGNIDFVDVKKEDAPTGIAHECSFTLNQVDRSDVLVFYATHSDIEVNIDGKCVYTSKQAGSLFRTSGSVWVRIPLTDADNGKTAQIVLFPIYDNYKDGKLDVYVGSESAIYGLIFSEALPELLIGICVVIVGLLMLGAAIYYNIRFTVPFRLYAISLLAIFSGIWRFTYSDFTFLAFEEQTTFIYTLSVVSLMFIALSMLNCVRMSDEKVKKAVRYGSIVYSVIYLAQLALQLAGLFDLRQSLTLIHITLIIGAIALFVDCILGLKENITSSGHRTMSYSWIIGMGVIVDLVLFYFSDFSKGMLFTLVAILIFVIIEGIKLLVVMSEQKKNLEKVNIDLMLSRTATMMSQIRSHFVFNLLNAISGMCKYDPEKADDTIVRFSRYLRSNIDIMENDKNIPFATDLQQLEDYVILEQVRFGDKIEFYTDIETDDFMIPPLILQPVVENSIKHGIACKYGSGTIILKTRKNDENVVITVEDDGVGFDVAELNKEKSVGLRNIRFRLEHLINGKMEIKSSIGKGTIVTITIPLSGE